MGLQSEVGGAVQKSVGDADRGPVSAPSKAAHEAPLPPPSPTCGRPQHSSSAAQQHGAETEVRSRSLVSENCEQVV